MDITGQYRIAAPREVVWGALNDPDVLEALHSRLQGAGEALRPPSSPPR